MLENGKMPSNALFEVEPGHFLESGTAKAYLAMKQDAAKEEIELNIPEPAGAYRSIDVQKDMHANPLKYGLDPNSSVPLAPVGYSTHGFGTRVDIITGSAREWVISNHGRYGFIREFGSADPGHFKYQYPTFAVTINQTGMENDMSKDEVIEAIADSPTIKTLVKINRRNEARLAILSEAIGIDPSKISDEVIDGIIERLTD